MEFKQKNLQKYIKNCFKTRKIILTRAKKKYIKAGFISEAFNKISSIKIAERAEYGKRGKRIKKSL